MEILILISFAYAVSKDYNIKMKDLRSVNMGHYKIISQPRLSSSPIFRNDGFYYHDFTILEKLYKNYIYKKAVNFLTFERYSVFNTYNEDK